MQLHERTQEKPAGEQIRILRNNKSLYASKLGWIKHSEK